MAPFCPNLSNKKVREKFEELTDIFGEDMAYFLWGKNGGYPLDYAPNGAPSILFKSLMDHYSDRKQALIAKAKVYSSNFKDWFGDWTKKYETGASKVIDFNDAVDFLFEVNPELSKVGTKSEYEQYIKTIFPNSISNSIYWHGTDSDFSDGLNTAKRGKGSGAPETQNEMYFNRQPWASLQYISGINRRIKDNEGFNNWVKLWWELKEALGNGRMDTDDWKNEIIGPNTRQSSPNKHGVFDRDKGGTHGKYLSERKARYGYENKSDKEFFEEVFDIRYGKETFNDWINRKRDEFKNLWNNRSVKNGIIPAILNIHNPIVEEGQNTYYEEQRKLFTQAKRNGNDAILSNKSKNEFGSDVAVVFNPNENVHFLGTKSDIEDFKKWKNNNQVSKVVDENGEPLVVYHGSNKYGFEIFDPSKSDDKISLFTSSSKWIASTYTSFKPLENTLVKKALLKGNAIDLIKNKDWKSLEKLINSVIDYNLPRPTNGNKKALDKIQAIIKGLDNSNLSEEEYLSLLADLTKAEDEYYYYGNYTFKVEQRIIRGKDNIRISIDDSYAKQFSSYYTEEGVIFRGSPEELIESLTFDTKVYDLFLNIKNPLILDDQVNEFGHANNWNNLNFSPAAVEVQNTDIWGNTISGTHKQTKTRDVAAYAKKNNYDGVIFKQIADKGGYQGYESLNPMTDADYLYEDMHIGEDSFNATNNLKSDVFIAFNPNNIKSATDNIGTFNTKDDNIYNSDTTEEYESVASIADYIWSYSPEDRAEIAREINNGNISIKCK